MLPINKQSGKLIWLECIRGIAALLVMFGHLFLYIDTLKKYDEKATVAIFIHWGRECVLLFFILSGIVVHYAFDKKQRSSLTFIKQRVVRLHPTLIICLCISLTIEFFAFNRTYNFNTIVGNLVPYSTMQGYLASILWETNPVIWSLTFEMFFYAIFGIVIIKKAKITTYKIYIWLLTSLSCIYFYFNKTNINIIDHFIMMFSFSGVWLIGFFIYKFRNYIYTDSKIAFISICILPIVSRIHLGNEYYNPLMFNLFGVVSGPLFVYLIRPTVDAVHVSNKKQTYLVIFFLYILSAILIVLDKSYSLVSKALYIGLPISASILVNFNSIFLSFKLIIRKYILPFFSYFGKYSYSIYLIHTPFIKFSNFFPSVHLSLKIFLILFATFGTSYVIENHIQPRINKKFL